MKHIPFIVALAIGLSACAAGSNPAANHANAAGDIAGFWLGLWHGWIAAITFIIGLFEPTVRAYEVHNNGNWYDLGFLLGIGAFGGGCKRCVDVVTKK